MNCWAGTEMLDRSALEFSGEWIPDGFQVTKIRRPQKDVPSWANSDSELRRAIVGPALRRYRIAYLYWRLGWNSREVAEELGISQSAVEQCIHNLKVAHRKQGDTLSQQSLPTPYREVSGRCAASATINTVLDANTENKK
jgi:hypothetical protein